MALAITLVTSNQTLNTSFDVHFFDASSDNIVFTLDDIALDGEHYIFKRIDESDSNGVTIQGFDETQTIDGEQSIQLLVNESFEIIAFGGKWETLLR